MLPDVASRRLSCDVNCDVTALDASVLLVELGRRMHVHVNITDADLATWSHRTAADRGGPPGAMSKDNTLLDECGFGAVGTHQVPCTPSMKRRKAKASIANLKSATPALKRRARERRAAVRRTQQANLELLKFVPDLDSKMKLHHANAQNLCSGPGLFEVGDGEHRIGAEPQWEYLGEWAASYVWDSLHHELAFGNQAVLPTAFTSRP